MLLPNQNNWKMICLRTIFTFGAWRYRTISILIVSDEHDGTNVSNYYFWGRLCVIRYFVVWINWSWIDWYSLACTYLKIDFNLDNFLTSAILICSFTGLKPIIFNFFPILSIQCGIIRVVCNVTIPITHVTGVERLVLQDNLLFPTLIVCGNSKLFSIFL